MAKIGTAHIEIKPVLNEEALAAIGQLIEDAVAAGVARGLAHIETAAVTNTFNITEASPPGAVAQQVARRLGDARV